MGTMQVPRDFMANNNMNAAGLLANAFNSRDQTAQHLINSERRHADQMSGVAHALINQNAAQNATTNAILQQQSELIRLARQSQAQPQAPLQAPPQQENISREMLREELAQVQQGIQQGFNETQSVIRQVGTPWTKGGTPLSAAAAGARSSPSERVGGMAPQNLMNDLGAAANVAAPAPEEVSVPPAAPAGSSSARGSTTTPKKVGAAGLETVNSNSSEDPAFDSATQDAAPDSTLAFFSPQARATSGPPLAVNVTLPAAAVGQKHDALGSGTTQATKQAAFGSPQVERPTVEATDEPLRAVNVTFQEAAVGQQHGSTNDASVGSSNLSDTKPSPKKNGATFAERKAEESMSESDDDEDDNDDESLAPYVPRPRYSPGNEDNLFAGIMVRTWNPAAEVDPMVASLRMKSAGSAPLATGVSKGFSDRKDFARTRFVRHPSPPKKRAKISNTRQSEDSPPWFCGQCGKDNRNDESKCSKCEAMRSTNNVTRSWGNFGALPPGKWRCELCRGENDEKYDKCEACETPREEEPATSNASSGGSPTSSVAGAARSTSVPTLTAPSNSGSGENSTSSAFAAAAPSTSGPTLTAPANPGSSGNSTSSAIAAAAPSTSGPTLRTATYAAASVPTTFGSSFIFGGTKVDCTGTTVPGPAAGALKISTEDSVTGPGPVGTAATSTFGTGAVGTVATSKRSTEDNVTAVASETVSKPGDVGMSTNTAVITIVDSKPSATDNIDSAVASKPENITLADNVTASKRASPGPGAVAVGDVVVSGPRAVGIVMPSTFGSSSVGTAAVAETVTGPSAVVGTSAFGTVRPSTFETGAIGTAAVSETVSGSSAVVGTNAVSPKNGAVSKGTNTAVTIAVAPEPSSTVDHIMATVASNPDNVSAVASMPSSTEDNIFGPGAIETAATASENADSGNAAVLLLPDVPAVIHGHTLNDADDVVLSVNNVSRVFRRGRLMPFRGGNSDILCKNCAKRAKYCCNSHQKQVADDVEGWRVGGILEKIQELVPDFKG